MSITLRPYIKDKTRYHVDMQVEHPITQAPLRKRIAAPAGLDERQAHRWGEKELEKWFKSLALPNPSQEDREEKARAGPESAARAVRDDARAILPRALRTQLRAIPEAGDPRGVRPLWRNHLSALENAAPSRDRHRQDRSLRSARQEGAQGVVDQRQPRQAGQDAPLGPAAEAHRRTFR
jgi:hypothetical protein